METYVETYVPGPPLLQAESLAVVVLPSLTIALLASTAFLLISAACSASDALSAHMCTGVWKLPILFAFWISFLILRVFVYSF